MKHLLTLVMVVGVLQSGATQAWAQTDVRRPGSQSGGAQGTRTLTGKVLDESGQPLGGATVVALDASGRTLKGAYSNADGSFSLAVPAGVAIRLRVSYIGYGERMVAVSESQNAVDVSMAETSSTLTEQVITGYGTQVRQDMTGASTRVGSKQLENIPTPSFDAMLQGQVPGLQVLSSNGLPGSAVRLRLRGQGSIGGGGQPLIVIDGVPIFNEDPSDRSFGENPTQATNLNPLSTINPNDIESIEVLQDAYASAIYGSRAANGVLVIKTKRGTPGETRVTANYSAGWSEPTRILPLLNGREWLGLHSELYSNTNGGAPLPSTNRVGFGNFSSTIAEANAYVNSDRYKEWYDYLFRDGRVQDASLSVSGGSEKTSFYTGLSYHQNNGFLTSNEYERMGLRTNVDQQVTDKLKVGVSLGLTRESNDQVRESYNGGLGAVQRNPALNIFPAFNPDGSYFGSGGPQPNDVGGNPVAVLENSSYIVTTLRTIGNAYFDWKIISDLSLRYEFGFDYANTVANTNINGPIRWVQQGVFNPAGNNVTFSGPFFQAPTFAERRQNWQNWNSRAILTYSRTFAEKHQVNAIGVAEALSSQREFIAIYTNGNAGSTDPFLQGVQGGLNPFVSPLPGGVGVPVMGGYNDNRDERYRFLSYITRVDYKYGEQFLFGVSARWDASSRFGPNNRWGFFPAVSGGWIASKATNLFVLPEWFTFLKVRGSWGRTGNAEIGNFSWADNVGGAGGYLGVPGTGLLRIPSPDLSWEQTDKWNLGVDFELWNGRVSGNIDAYYHLANQLLLLNAVPASTGFNNTLVNNPNVELRNKGIDVSIRGVILEAADVKQVGLKAILNLGFLDSEVLTTGGLAPGAFEQGPGDARVVEGQPVGVAFLVPHAFVDPATGAEYFYNRDGVAVLGPIGRAGGIDLTVDRRPFGSPIPWLTGGLNLELTYRRFDLSTQWNWQVGNYVYDDGAKFQIGEVLSSNQRREILDRWTQPGDVTSVPRLGFINDFGANNSTRFLYLAEFLRLRQLTLGYTFSPAIASKLKLTSLRVYATAFNLLTFTRFPGWDPEVVRYANDGNARIRTQDANISSAAPYLPTPQARTISFGVNVTF